jgi:MerR HTH family regulatory protein
MMVHYSGRNGSLHRYSCSRTYLAQGTRRPCQSIGGRRLDSTVVDAFLEAVNPASVQATARAVDQLEAEHAERVQLGQLALEQAEFEAGRRQRQFDACEPENRLVARTLETALEQALADADQRRRALSDLQRERPAPLSDAERRSLRRLAGNLGSIWNAHATTDQDRKQLLRALLDDVVLEIDRERHTGAVQLVWQGGARTELTVRLNHSGLKRTSTPVDLIDLIGRLAQHSSDREIAAVLSKQRRQTPTGLSFTAARVAGIRERAGIPAAAPPTPGIVGVSINEAARQLGVCTQTIRRWLAEGLLPAEQTSPHAPWRISITDQVRARFVPEVPAGYLKLDQAARQLGVARQTVLNQIRSGHRHAVHVVEGKRRGLRIQIHPNEQGQLTPRPSDEKAAGLQILG